MAQISTNWNKQSYFQNNWTFLEFSENFKESFFGKRWLFFNIWVLQKITNDYSPMIWKNYLKFTWVVQLYYYYYIHHKLFLKNLRSIQIKNTSVHFFLLTFMTASVMKELQVTSWTA